jgi:hypothetical protein
MVPGADARSGRSQAQGGITRAVVCYFETAFLRFFGMSVTTGKTLASCASLACLSARRRSMFLRTAIALFSTSTIARTPSSRASRCRLARATLTGDGSADFMLVISSGLHSEPSKPAQSCDRAGTSPFQYIRETALTAQASDKFSALVLPRIVSVLISKLTF